MTTAWKWSCVPVRSVTSTRAPGKAARSLLWMISGLGMRGCRVEPAVRRSFGDSIGGNVRGGIVNGLAPTMDRTRAWPDVREGWILYQDEDLLVVDKPAGVASQAADAGRPDDIVTRLKSHFAARGESTYLGV